MKPARVVEMAAAAADVRADARRSRGGARVWAMPGGALPAITVTPSPGGGQTYSLTLQVLILMTVLTLLPAIVLMMTSFTRIVIVLVDPAAGARRGSDAA